MKCKTRNFSIKNYSENIENSKNSSVSKTRPYASISGVLIDSTKHKRSGTTLISSCKASDLTSSAIKSKKILKKEIQKQKISKEILKRLKRRTINQLNEKSRMNNLEFNSINFMETGLKTKGIPKDIPLPISSTSKCLKEKNDKRS